MVSLTDHSADFTLSYFSAIIYSNFWKQELHKNGHIFLAANLSKIYNDITVCLSIDSQRNGN